MLGVEHNGDRRAYVIEELGDGAVNDTLGSERVAIFSKIDGPAAAAFLAEANGQTLTFKLRWDVRR